MNKDFIPHQQSLELKELGFDEPCFRTSWDFNITDRVNVGLPLYQQAFRWFRESHGLVALFEIGTQDFSYDIYNIKENVSELGMSRLYYNSTYEEAELACLNRLIEIVKNK